MRERAIARGVGGPGERVLYECRVSISFSVQCRAGMILFDKAYLSLLSLDSTRIERIVGPRKASDLRPVRRVHPQILTRSQSLM